MGGHEQKKPVAKLPEGQRTPPGFREIEKEVLPNGEIVQVFLPTRRPTEKRGGEK